jgi:hypothetical protein
MATIGSYLFIIFPFIEIYYVLNSHVFPLLTPNIPFVVGLCGSYRLKCIWYGRLMVLIKNNFS